LEQKPEKDAFGGRQFLPFPSHQHRCAGSSSLVAWRKQMALVRTLIDTNQDHIEPTLSASLRDLYDGDLHFPESPSGRPFVIANFVSTLDGVVSYQIKGQAGGSTISGSDPADLFIMGLLRASADAVIVGARTVQDVSPESLWTPEYSYPDAKHLYNDYRVNTLHKPERPSLVVISGNGRLDLERAIFRTPAMRTIVITTAAGRDALARAGATKFSSVQIHALDSSGGTIEPLAILRFLYTQLGVRRLLHEGGPTLLGQFLTEGAIDELFLTLSPQIAGRRADALRPGLVQGTEFMPNCAPWFQLLSVKQSAAHLYLRYQSTGSRTSVA
jgi:riboflavin biosynthesis pyrimidine reductase